MSLIGYELVGHLATLTLDRPEALNALSSEMWADLRAALRQFATDDDAHVLIVQGNGRAFCAGRDMKENAETGDSPPTAYDQYANVFGMPDTDKPMIAAVQGFAVGAGWYMAAGCDIRVAAEGTKFAMTEIRTGLLGPYFVPAAEGMPWALGFELAVVGEQVDAQRLLSAGLLNEVVPVAELSDRARAWAEKLLALPPEHVRQTKRMMRRFRPMPDTMVIDDEVSTRSRLDALSDTTEAVQAFVQKRTPRFTGT